MAGVPAPFPDGWQHPALPRLCRMAHAAGPPGAQAAAATRSPEWRCCCPPLAVLPPRAATRPGCKPMICAVQRKLRSLYVGCSFREAWEAQFLTLLTCWCASVRASSWAAACPQTCPLTAASCHAFPQGPPLPSPDSCCLPGVFAPVQVMSRAPTEASAAAVACHDPRAGLVTGGHRVRAPRFLAPHPLVQAAAQVGPHTVSAEGVLAMTDGPAAEPARPGHSTAYLAVLLLRCVSVAQEWCDAEPCTRWRREAQLALHCKLAAQRCIELSAV